MAVIPSFSAYAKAPDLAGAFLGAERIRQEAAEAAARIQLGREQLAQQQVEANMQLQAQQQAQQNEFLRKQQDAEIQRAYNQAQLGIAERNIATQEAYNESRIAEAAEGFAARAAYKRDVDGGMSPIDAARKNLAGQAGFASTFPNAGTPGRMDDRSRIMLQSAARRLEQARRFVGEARGSKIPDAQKELESAQAEFDRLNVNPTPSISTGGLPAPSGIQPRQVVPMVPPANEQGFIGIESGPNLFQHTPSSGLVPPSTMTATNAPAVQAGETIRRTKDGRRAVFNSQTKEFLRYAD